MRGRPDDWTPVVRGNWKRVTAYIVSSRNPSCLRMARDEVRHVNRVMQAVLLEDVTNLKPPKHWFMAVIVCPSDEFGPLAEWAKRHDPERVHFYLHRDADSHALAPWQQAGLPLSRVEAQRFTAYGPLHAKLGLALSDQVYSDFAP